MTVVDLNAFDVYNSERDKNVKWCRRLNKLGLLRNLLPKVFDIKKPVLDIDKVKTAFSFAEQAQIFKIISSSNFTPFCNKILFLGLRINKRKTVVTHNISRKPETELEAEPNGSIKCCSNHLTFLGLAKSNMVTLTITAQIRARWSPSRRPLSAEELGHRNWRNCWRLQILFLSILCT
ncbi:hypothetical protein LguiB_033960 [Lonicera macranthoides]